jgi:purine-binding chemotaxis protein CheW
MTAEARPQEAWRQVLEARARALARPIEPPRGETLRLLGFELAGERYALELTEVLEVFRPRSVSRLPGSKTPLLGLTAWRGELVAVLDLRQMLGLGSEPPGDLRFAVVLGGGGTAVAVPADTADELLELDPHEVRAPAEGVAVRRELVRGVTPDARVVLDSERLVGIHLAGGRP